MLHTNSKISKVMLGAAYDVGVSLHLIGQSPKQWHMGYNLQYTCDKFINYLQYFILTD